MQLNSTHFFITLSTFMLHISVGANEWNSTFNPYEFREIPNPYIVSAVPIKSNEHFFEIYVDHALQGRFIHYNDNQKLASRDNYAKVGIRSLTRNVLNDIQTCLKNNNGVMQWIQWQVLFEDSRNKGAFANTYPINQATFQQTRGKTTELRQLIDSGENNQDLVPSTIYKTSCEELSTADLSAMAFKIVNDLPRTIYAIPAKLSGVPGLQQVQWRLEQTEEIKALASSLAILSTPSEPIEPSFTYFDIYINKNLRGYFVRHRNNQREISFDDQYPAFSNINSLISNVMGNMQDNKTINDNATIQWTVFFIDDSNKYYITRDTGTFTVHQNHQGFWELKKVNVYPGVESYCTFDGIYKSLSKELSSIDRSKMALLMMSELPSSIQAVPCTMNSLHGLRMSQWSKKQKQEIADTFSGKILDTLYNIKIEDHFNEFK